jgi:tetratricopeptide (TPR) repeat protein
MPVKRLQKAKNIYGKYCCYFKVVLSVFMLVCVLAQNIHADDGMLSNEIKQIFTSGELLRGESLKSIEIYLTKIPLLKNDLAKEFLLKRVTFFNKEDLFAVEDLEKLLNNIINTSIKQPYLKYGAQKILAEVFFREGNFQDGHDIINEAGEISKWKVCGPFGNYGYANFYSAYQPEGSPVSLSDIYQGTRGEVVWKDIFPSPFTGKLMPYEWVYPRGKGGAVYLYSTVKAKGATSANCYISSGASWKLWLNNKIIAKNDRIESYKPVSKVFPVSLSKGKNNILIKFVSLDRRDTIAIRLEDKSGNKLSNVIITPENMDGSENKETINYAAEKVQAKVKPLLCKALEAEADKNKANPYLFAAAAEMYKYEEDFNQATMLIDKAVKLCKSSESFCGIYLLAGEIYYSAPHLPREVRSNKAKLFYRKALLAYPKCVPALLNISVLEYNDENYSEALDFIDKAISINPKCLDAHRKRIGIAINQKWLVDAQRWNKEFLKINGAEKSSHIFNYKINLKLDNTSRQIKSIISAKKKDASEFSIWLSLIECYYKTGEKEKCAGVIEALLEFAPNSASVRYAAASYYYKINMMEKALKNSKKSLQLLSDDESIWNLHADILLSLDKKSEAIEAYKKSMKLNPSQRNIERLICKLSNKPFDFWSKYQIDLKKTLKEEASKLHSGATVRLVDQTVMTVYKDGSRLDSVYQLQKVLTSNGISNAATVPIFGELQQIRTIFPNGKFLEPVRIPGRRQFTMPALRPGASVEYRFLMDSTENSDYTFYAPSWYFRSPDSFEDFVRTEYIIRVPDGMKLKYVQRNFNKAPKITKEKGYTVYHWLMEDMNKVWKEDNTPQISEFLPYVEIGAGLSWKRVANDLEREVLGRVRPTFLLKKLLSDIFAGKKAKNHQDKIKLIVNYVLANIEHKPQGQAASLIAERKIGNRNILAMTLMKMSGIDVKFAGIRPGKKLMYEASWELPQKSLFPMRALAVFLPDSIPLWLDLRYKINSPGKFLEEFSSATAFIPSKDGGDFYNLPEISPTSFSENEELFIKLKKDKAEISGNRTVRGIKGAHRKKLFGELSERNRIRVFERRMDERFSCFAAEKIEYPFIDEVGKNYYEKFKASARRLIKRSGKEFFSMPLFLELFEITDDLEINPEMRKNPFRLYEYMVKEDLINITLPKNFKIKDNLPFLQIKNKFGNYKLKVIANNRNIQISRKYSFVPQFVNLHDWPELVKMAREIRSSELAKIILTKK